MIPFCIIDRSANINICADTVSVVVQHIEGLIYNRIGIVIETLLHLFMRGKSLLRMAFRENCNQLCSANYPSTLRERTTRADEATNWFSVLSALSSPSIAHLFEM